MPGGEETTKALIPRLDDVQKGMQMSATFFTAWGEKKGGSNEKMSRTNVDARQMKAAAACLATSKRRHKLVQWHMHSLQAFQEATASHVLKNNKSSINSIFFFCDCISKKASGH